MRHGFQFSISSGILNLIGLSLLLVSSCHGANYTVHVVTPAVTNHLILIVISIPITP